MMAWVGSFAPSAYSMESRGYDASNAGLILQVTQNIGALEVHHAGRAAGQSGYTFGRLLRLWASTFVNFSVMPLRLATLLGLVMAGVGLVGLALVFYWWRTGEGPDYGWGSLMGALLVFSGTQLVMLGLKLVMSCTKLINLSLALIAFGSKLIAFGSKLIAFGSKLITLGPKLLKAVPKLVAFDGHLLAIGDKPL